jgi:hypothetical protein
MSSGTDIFYAHFHQEGGGNLPQRMIETFPDAETLSNMATVIVDGVAAGIHKAVQ